jgi:transposase-like protein
MSKEPEGTGASRELPERWSSERKTEIVLRLLRGEDLGEVSREIQVPAHEIEEWRRVFIETGTSGLKRRSGDDPAERELRRTQAKLGETMMKLELAEHLLEKRGYGEELRKLKRQQG